MWRCIKLAKPLVFTMAGYWMISRDYKMATSSAPFVITDNRSSGGLIKEMRLKDN